MAKRKPLKVATPSRENLRGLRAWVAVDGKFRRITVITHIRNDRWLVEGRELPKRFLRPDRQVRRTTVHHSEIFPVVRGVVL